MQIGIYLFDDVEVLDATGPYEVFTTASRVHRRRHAGGPDDAAPTFEVTTVARRAGPVRARAGLRLEADAGFADHPRLDVLVVPGGVVDVELGRPDVVAWIAAQARAAALVASVCTGAFLLARAGLLDGLEATTHGEDVAALRAAHPAVTVRDDRRWIDAGRVVTSAGIAAGIDMSLHLVARLHGRELALATARQMEVDWRCTA